VCQALAKFPPFSHSETHAPQLFITPTPATGRVPRFFLLLHTVLPARRMVSHSSAAVAPAVRASTPVQSKTRICISGFAKYSHNTGHSKKLADAVVKAYPQQYETWYHMASTELEVWCPPRSHKEPDFANSPLTHHVPTKSRAAAIPCTAASSQLFC